jgi:hypothetical protein
MDIDAKKEPTTMRGCRSRFVTQLTAMTGLVALSVFAGLGNAAAGVGDSRGTVLIPGGAKCGEGETGTAVLSIPGGKAGFPAIPTLLVTSCSNKLFLLDPSSDTATLVKTITTTVSPANGWGALTLRADKGNLLACTVTATGTDVYSIDFSPFNTVADGTATKIRSAPAGPAGSTTSTCAGIAWDPATKTIYQSTTGPAVIRYPETGNALAPIGSGCPAGVATGGVGIAGTSLFVGCGTASF